MLFLCTFNITFSCFIVFLDLDYFEGVTVDSQEDAIDELLFQHGMQMNYPRPTYKQEYLASTCSQHDFQIYQLELPHRGIAAVCSLF